MSEPIRHRTKSQRLLPLVLVLWLAALIPAARALLKYEWTPGSMQAAPAQLSGSKLLTQASAHGTYKTGQPANAGLLIVAVHPLCSCTRATLEELEKSAANWRQPYQAVILVYTSKKSAVQQVSEHTPPQYLRDAQQALHAEIVTDEDGQQAARLGALTSGEILYYSAADQHGDRRLLFSGGVTAGRGMVGENTGIDGLEQAVKLTTQSSKDKQQAHAPVYGCGLAMLAKQEEAGRTAK